MKLYQTMRYLISAFTLLVLTLGTNACAQSTYENKPNTQAFIQEMVQKHGFQKEKLQSLFASAHRRDDIITTMKRPAEGKPWYEYRSIFLTDQRIDGGIAFWKQNKSVLEAAAEEYGVPAQIIVAIIGVETRYGANTGRYSVLDSISTLAFDYPPRADFFRGELESFLLLTREQNLDPTALLGSYAGAVGMPQFIPTSYRKYAIDFDKDGKVDLWNSTADAIGSVANYLSTFGWEKDQMIAVPAQVRGKGYHKLIGGDLEPKNSLQEILDAGVVTSNLHAQATTSARLLQLKAKDADEYWVSLRNFYVITRYNHSTLYAMAVFQLSEEIRAKM